MPEITIRTRLNPTEDREKVVKAVTNIFPDSTIEVGGDDLEARSSSGDKLREIIIDEHIRDTARSVMLHGIKGNTTSFKLNKQVAFMGKVSFIDHPVALGSIDVVIEDADIERTIDHLAESTVRKEEAESISVSSPAFSIIDFHDVLDFISEHFDAWEVVAEGKHSLPEIEGRLKGLVPSYDIELSAHAPMSDINIGSLNPRMWGASLRELTSNLEAASRLDMDVYTVHPAFLTPIGFVDRAAVQEKAREALMILSGLSEEVGVKVALENMPFSPFSTGQTPEELLKLIEGTGLGICFDTGHANTTKQVDGFLHHSDRFFNVHVHDNRGERDEHLPIGDGTIDFEHIVRSLSSYSGRLVIEARGLEEALISEGRLSAILP